LLIENEHEEDTRFRDDQIFRARLTEIKLRTYPFTDRDGHPAEGQSLDWWWEITGSTEGPAYIGRKVKGECHPKMTNREDNKFRQWAEALLNREIPVGMKLDTDDLVGLEADILIRLRQDRKERDKWWPQVDGIAPVDGALQDVPF
jgi:hypothetical protein